MSRLRAIMVRARVAIGAGDETNERAPVGQTIVKPRLPTTRP